MGKAAIGHQGMQVFLFISYAGNKKGFKLSEVKIPVFFWVIHPILGVFSSFFHFRWKTPVSSGAVFSGYFHHAEETCQPSPQAIRAIFLIG